MRVLNPLKVIPSLNTVTLYLRTRPTVKPFTVTNHLYPQVESNHCLLDVSQIRLPLRHGGVCRKRGNRTPSILCWTTSLKLCFKLVSFKHQEVASCPKYKTLQTLTSLYLSSHPESNWVILITSQVHHHLCFGSVVPCVRLEPTKPTLWELVVHLYPRPIFCGLSRFRSELLSSSGIRFHQISLESNYILFFFFFLLSR